jgi:hypothetical protein
MRLVGIIAVFVLALTSIVEGAFLVRLSSKVQALDDQLRGQPVVALESDTSARRARPSNEPVRLPVPRLDTKATAPSESAPASDTAVAAAPAVLGAALSTPEGRSHLKEALKKLEDQDRQVRMIEGIRNDIEREKKYQERIARALNLSGGEQGTIHQMYASMQATRQRILDEMQTGAKTARQADDEIDQLEDQTETAVRNMLGEDRLKQMREARKNERQQEQQQRAARRGRPIPNAPVPAAPAQ